MTGLFLFYLGGNVDNANIEVHDVQFAAVEKPEDAFHLLKKKWFGQPNKLHIDGYAKISWADGYDIYLDIHKNNDEKRLYFVNMGGYRPDCFAELHEFGLFVAATEEEAKNKAKETLLCGTLYPHKDDLKTVDECISIREVDGYYVHLRYNPAGTPAKPLFQGYLPVE